MAELYLTMDPLMMAVALLSGLGFEAGVNINHGFFAHAPPELIEFVMAFIEDISTGLMEAAHA